MSRCFNRQGKEISVSEWTSSFRSSEKRVAEDTVDGYWVSTVWLGLNYRSGEGPPLIFETMVFSQEDGNVTDWVEKHGDRYSTEEEALEGHRRVVDALRAGTLELYGA